MLPPYCPPKLSPRINFTKDFYKYKNVAKNFLYTILCDSLDSSYPLSMYVYLPSYFFLSLFPSQHHFPIPLNHSLSLFSILNIVFPMSYIVETFILFSISPSLFVPPISVYLCMNVSLFPCYLLLSLIFLSLCLTIGFSHSLSLMIHVGRYIFLSLLFSLRFSPLLSPSIIFHPCRCLYISFSHQFSFTSHFLFLNFSILPYLSFSLSPPFLPFSLSLSSHTWSLNFLIYYLL